MNHKIENNKQYPFLFAHLTILSIYAAQVNITPMELLPSGCSKPVLGLYFECNTKITQALTKNEFRTALAS
jgi:hypothetical protein